MPINLALIGCGQIASAHIKAANTLANTELLFAIDSDLERARQTAIDQTSHIIRPTTRKPSPAQR